jgi:hypothetical protein
VGPAVALRGRVRVSESRHASGNPSDTEPGTVGTS